MDWVSTGNPHAKRKMCARLKANGHPTGRDAKVCNTFLNDKAWRGAHGRAKPKAGQNYSPTLGQRGARPCNGRKRNGRRDVEGIM